MVRSDPLRLLNITPGAGGATPTLAELLKLLHKIHGVEWRGLLLNRPYISSLNLGSKYIHADKEQTCACFPGSVSGSRNSDTVHLVPYAFVFVIETANF
jgi:hypothetical protein